MTLYEVSKTLKLTESESGMVIASSWDQGWNGDLLLNEQNVSFIMVNKFYESAEQHFTYSQH